MPAHDAKDKDRNFMIVGPNIEFHNQMFLRGRANAGWNPFEKKEETSEDRGFSIQFYWHANTRTWEVTGWKLPYVAATTNKELELTVTKTFDISLTQGQGDILIRFLEWIEFLVHGIPQEPVGEDLEPEEVQEGLIT
jgi:hypothetical protein